MAIQHTHGKDHYQALISEADNRILIIRCERGTFEVQILHPDGIDLGQLLREEFQAIYRD